MIAPGTSGGALRWALWLLWLLPLSAAVAGQARVVVVADEHNTVHQQFIGAFRRQLDGATVIEVVRDSAGREALRRASLLVSVGSLAARGLAAMQLEVPIINSLIAEADWRRLSAESGERQRRTAIYLEQPPSRMLALVKTALPDRQQITIALGPSSQRVAGAIEQNCRRQGLRCEVVMVADEGDIERALQMAAASGKVLLVLPDPRVVNATTARNLILGAYRRGVALVGYSRAMVKAGALMAVHSTPEQLGEDAAAMAHEILTRGAGPLPVSRYPSRYSVSVNYQLARALRLDLETEAELAKAIHKAERNE